jgi:hypothetical protein
MAADEITVSPMAVPLVIELLLRSLVTRCSGDNVPLMIVGSFQAILYAGILTSQNP